MDYPEFNSLSVLSLLISISSISLAVFFIRVAIERVKKIETKLNSVVKSFNNLYANVMTRTAKDNRTETINYMEGDIDLVKEGKKATFKAIYHPRKINRK